jgi:hypothetical protein
VTALLVVGGLAQADSLLSLDIGVGDLQPDFQAMAPDATLQTFGSYTAQLTPVGTSMGSRSRGTPTDAGAFTQGALLRDFVFASAADPDTSGLDAHLTGLMPNWPYKVTVWSFDTGSGGNRVSDWFANGTQVIENYTFNGTVPPTSNADYQFSFPAWVDGTGGLTIAGRQDATSSSHAIFLDGLQVSHLPTARVLAVDIGASSAKIQPGFDLMAPNTSPQTFGDITVTVSGVNTTLSNRDRTTPTDTPPGFTQGLLFQDFIFANGNQPDPTTTGLDALIEGLEPEQPYWVTVWSFDTGSGGNRVSDWFANGALVVDDYTFSGSVLPTTNEDYQFRVPLFADADGKILLSGRFDADTVNPTYPAVFLNGLAVERVLIPEPATVSLLGLGLAAMLRRRRPR